MASRVHLLRIASKQISQSHLPLIADTTRDALPFNGKLEPSGSWIRQLRDSQQ